MTESELCHPIMKLGEFLTTLARKSNMENDAALVSILSNSDLANRDIADSFANSLDANLMSLDGAKNNPAVLNHFKPIILKAVDDKYAILAEKYGISDEMTAEKSTYKKSDILEAKIEAKIKDLEAKQGKAGDATKEAELTKQLQTLQTQLGTLTDQKAQELNGLKSQHETAMTDMLVKFNLTGKKFANKELPIEVNTTVAKTLLEAKLKESGAILVNENGTLKLKQAANPTMDYVDTGFKAVSFSDFTDQTLAASKMIEVNGGVNPPATPAPVVIPGGATPTNTSQFNAAIAAALGDIQTQQ